MSDSLLLPRQKHCQIAKYLLGKGANPCMEGWIQIGDSWTWTFGTPLELAIKMKKSQKQDAAWQQSVQNIIILLKDGEKQWGQTLPLPGKPSNLRTG